MRAHSSRDKVEYGTERSFTGQSRVIWKRRRSRAHRRRCETSRDSPCLASFRLASRIVHADIISVFTETRATGIRFPAIMQAALPVCVWLGEEVGVAPGARSLYLPLGNVHSRYAAAAMARARAPAKNTKCKTCSAICLPLCGERRYKFRRA